MAQIVEKQTNPRRSTRSASGNNFAGRTPPQNVEAEQSVLGALLIDKDAIVKVAEMLRPEHFYRDAHAEIYNAVVSLYEKREPADIVTVTDELKLRGTYDDAGGSGYLTTLVNFVPTSAHIENYARIVKDKAVRRQLIAAAARISEMGYEEGEDVKALMDTAEQSLFGISQQHFTQNFIPVKDTLAETFDRIEMLKRKSGSLRGVPTGFGTLDKKLSGLQESNLVILAARPSVGKTTLAMNIAMHAAVNEKIPVGIFSLEMSKEQLVDMFLSAVANVDSWRLSTGHLDDEDFAKLPDAMGELAEAPLYIDDTPGASILEMRTKARRLQAEKGLQLVIVDYLQLVRGRNLENRVQEVSEISQALKNLARELKIPVLALSQLSRSIESRQTRVPQLSDLRESGCLAGDTLIMRADTGELVQIKDLIDKRDIPVYSLGKDWQVVVKRISDVFSSGFKRLFEIKTRSGRVIKASANHPFRTLSGWSRLDELKVGGYVALPRSLRPLQPRPVLSDDELILLAHLIGDGCVLPRQPVHYTSADLENIKIVSDIAQRLFGIKPRLIQQRNWWHLYLPSPNKLARGRYNPVSNWFKQLGLDRVRAKDKVLPQTIFNSDQRQMKIFLRHLWSTDGNISLRRSGSRGQIGSIYYSSTSKVLAYQVQHLLLRLGIGSTVGKVPNGQHNLSYGVHIQGSLMQLQFLKEIGSFGSRGLVVPALVSLLNKVSENPNLDVIPRDSWKSVVEPAKAAQGVGWGKVAAGLNISYSGSSLFKSGLSRERMNRVATALRSPSIMQLANSGVYWDEIISITPLGIEEVFDATVPETHNFVANDFIVHNSIEQDADVVMFLYREDPEKVEDIKLLISKHRSGEIGDIDLKFKGERRRFFGVERTRGSKE